MTGNGTGNRNSNEEHRANNGVRTLQHKQKHKHTQQQTQKPTKKMLMHTYFLYNPEWQEKIQQNQQNERATSSQTSDATAPNRHTNKNKTT